MTPDSHDYKFNVNKSPVDARDWKISAKLIAIQFPPTLDYRESMFPIRDQGDQGSCAAMAGAAMKEWQEVQDIAFAEYMSPQFIYNNREGGDEGMYTRDLMKILNKLGDCPEIYYPYGTTGKIPAWVYDMAKNYIIQGYALVQSIDEFKTALFLNGPCVIAVPVFNMTERMWYQRSGDKQLGGHLMCSVGYNEEGFIIRNSWGTEWGQAGYCIFPYKDWGMQWEVWSTVDQKSSPIIPDPTPKKVCFLIRWWNSIFN
jgi:hypothetical protein